MLNDAWVGWYERRLVSPDALITTRRARVVWTHERDVNYEGLPVKEPREFFRAALPALRAWRTKDVDIGRPIEYLLAAAEHAKGTAAQKFASAYLALENIVSIHAENTGMQLSIGEQRFQQELEPKLRACIKTTLSAGRNGQPSLNL